MTAQDGNTRTGRGIAAVIGLLGGGLVVGAVLLWTGEGGQRYTVRAGDTLWAIAQRHGVTVEELRAWNHLEGDLIEVGQRLVIRGGGDGAPPAESTGATASVVSPASGGAKEAPSAAGDFLALPPEKPCLDPPTAADVQGDEPTLVASRGLDAASIRSALEPFLPHLGRCVQEGAPWPRGTVDLRITVACTGRVSQVERLGARGVAEETARCVAETIRYTPFPAHDQPDGFVFRYPVTFEGG